MLDNLFPSYEVTVTSRNVAIGNLLISTISCFAFFQLQNNAVM